MLFVLQERGEKTDAEDKKKVVEVQGDKRLRQLKRLLIKTQRYRLGGIKRKELNQHRQQKNDKKEEHKDMNGKYRLVPRSGKGGDETL